MPESKTRKKPTPRRKPAVPPPNALAAESTTGKLGFEFRGHRFEIDVNSVDFGRAMFAMQVAARGGSDITARFNQMLDSFEAILGQQQVATLYEVAPDLFSSEAVQREFWEALTKLTVGSSLGERSAS